METFTVRDLREHTGALIHDAEIGKLSLITKHGQPIFLAVPFDEAMLKLGLRPAMAAKLYRDETLTLGKSAKLAEMSLEAFIAMLGKLDIPIVNYPPQDLDEELKSFE